MNTFMNLGDVNKVREYLINIGADVNATAMFSETKRNVELSKAIKEGTIY